MVSSHLVCEPTIRQPGFNLPRQQWSLLNRFRTEQLHCGACRRKWRLTDTDLCPCGETQMMSHIIESCALTKLNGGLSLLHSADKTLFRGWPVMVHDTHTRRSGCCWIIFGQAMATVVHAARNRVSLTMILWLEKSRQCYTSLTLVHWPNLMVIYCIYMKWMRLPSCEWQHMASNVWQQHLYCASVYTMYNLTKIIVDRQKFEEGTVQTNRNTVGMVAAIQIRMNPGSG